MAVARAGQWGAHHRRAAALQAKSRRKLLGSSALVVAALVLVVPVGIALTWTTSGWRTRGRVLATVLAVLAWTGVVLVAGPPPWSALTAADPAGGPGSNGGPAASATPAPTGRSSTRPSPSSAGSPSPSRPSGPFATTRPPSTGPGEPSGPPASAGPAATALGTLGRLPVRAPAAGFDAAAFGRRWADVDGNGCSTRDDVLRLDLTGVQTSRSARCVVVSGTLVDPWSGERIAFRRGIESSSAVQVDRVVSLSSAWATGASEWSPARRAQFANDPFGLVAVGQRSAIDHDDADATRWLPSRPAARCDYVARQVAVKQRYGLGVTAAEKAALTGVLAACPDTRLPTDRP